MFWRFGFHNASTIESLIEREGATVEDIMGEDELVQEVKGQSPKLIEFLCKPNNLALLLGYILDPGTEEPKAYKYQFVAAEIFGCENYIICEAVLKNPTLLSEFWTLLDRPAPLSPLHANYFVKINVVLLSKKPAEMIEFMKNEKDCISRMLKHVGTSAVSDLILKLITLEESSEAQGVIQWLSNEGIIPHLFSQLNPINTCETHCNAAQTLMDIISVSFPQQNLEQMSMGATVVEPSGSHINSVGNELVDQMKSKTQLQTLIGYMVNRDAENSTSSLANGINIIMELFRRYCSEIEQSEILNHEYQVQLQANRPATQYPTQQKLRALACDLNDLFQVLGEHLNAFTDLLMDPKAVTGPVDTTLGKQIPLGCERLKICELFAEVLHLQYLFTSSPLFDLIVQATPANEKGIADGLILLSSRFVEENIMSKCIDLFFAFKWNNFLHSVVYDMIAKVLNTFTHIYSSSPTTEGGLNNHVNSEDKMKQLRNSVKLLLISIFKQGKLTVQIVAAQRQNDYEVEQPKGVRLGYMGHLTYIADEVCKLFEKCSVELEADLKEYITSTEWLDYVSHALHETKDRDKQTLGGARPNMPYGQQQMLAAGDEVVSSKPSTEKKIANIDDDYVPSNSDNEAYHEQFARYLTQQLVKDIPDRFLGADSSDEEDSVANQWMSIEGREIDFDIGEALSASQVQGLGDDETASDDLTSDLALSKLDEFDTSSFPVVAEYDLKESVQDTIINEPNTQVKIQENWADFSKMESNNQ